MSEHGARERLEAKQTELLAALLGNQPDPPGFDPTQLRTQSASLRAKRRRIVAKLRPDLPARLGEKFRPLFDAYDSRNPRRTGTRARADAQRFSRWLIRRGALRPRLPRPWD